MISSLFYGHYVTLVPSFNTNHLFSIKQLLPFSRLMTRLHLWKRSHDSNDSWQGFISDLNTGGPLKPLNKRQRLCFPSKGLVNTFRIRSRLLISFIIFLVFYFQTMKNVVVMLFTLWVSTSLILLGSTVQGYRHLSSGPSMPVDACQYKCGNDVYRCDLRCKYWGKLRGHELKSCHTKCADLFLTCFISCYN